MTGNFMDPRTFIAIELDTSLQKSLQHIQDELRTTSADISWVKPTNIHVTLKFLGEIAPPKVKAIIDIFPEIFQDFPSFEVELNTLGIFPKIEHPKVIWAGIQKGAEEIKSLVTVLENALRQLGFPKERREFAAHVTIGRVRSLKNREALVQAIKNFTFKKPFLQTVNKIIFFKSTLSAHGPIYQSLTMISLRVPHHG